MPCSPAAGANVPVDTAAGLLPLSVATGVCAAADADTVSAAAITHDAHDAASIRCEVNTDANTDPNADPSDVSNVIDPSGERDINSGDSDETGDTGETQGGTDGDKLGDRRETKREPRRLRDKEIGNVVGGQRNMPEILSPCG